MQMQKFKLKLDPVKLRQYFGMSVAAGSVD